MTLFVEFDARSIGPKLGDGSAHFVDILLRDICCPDQVDLFSLIVEVTCPAGSGSAVMTVLMASGFANLLDAVA